MTGVGGGGGWGKPACWGVSEEMPKPSLQDARVWDWAIPSNVQLYDQVLFPFSLRLGRNDCPSSPSLLDLIFFSSFQIVGKQE